MVNFDRVETINNFKDLNKLFNEYNFKYSKWYDYSSYYRFAKRNEKYKAIVCIKDEKPVVLLELNRKTSLITKCDFELNVLNKKELFADVCCLKTLYPQVIC